MTYVVLKVAVTVVLVVAASEIAKRNTLAGGLVASLPIVSLLAMVWLYTETRDAEKVSSFATGILWMIVPSLALFILLPLLLRRGVTFPLGIAISITVTVALYAVMLTVLGRYGVGG